MCMEVTWPPTTKAMYALCIAQCDGVDAPLTQADDILVQWRLRRKIEQARTESAILNKSSGRGFLLDTRQGCGQGEMPHPLNARITPHPQCMCCAGHHCCHLAAPAGGVANLICQCGCHVGAARRGQGEGLRKSQQVQTSPIPNTDLPGGVSGLSPPGGGHCPATPTTAKVDVATSGNRDAPTLGQDTPDTEAASRHVTQTAQSADHKARAPPTHGGLALRDLTLSEEEETFTMTFNTELETLMASTPMQGHAGQASPLPLLPNTASTPVHVKGIEQDTAGQDGQGPPLQLLPQPPASMTCLHVLPWRPPPVHECTSLHVHVETASLWDPNHKYVGFPTS